MVDNTFEFNDIEKVNNILAKYPKGRQASASLPLLDLAQRQSGGYLTKEILEYIANFLSVEPIKIYEVATFYTMFNTKPVGKYLVQVCRTTPCWLRSSDSISDTCKKNLNINFNETSEDGLFTLVEVECLGACANAPVIQINDNYYEDLTPETTDKLLNDLRSGKNAVTGSQINRQCSEPVS